MSRGINNHNPGNIRHGDNWQGLRDIQTDKEFCQFIAPEWGIRAIIKIIRNYERNYGLNTVRQIITRWAPPNENNTESYIAYVCQQVGVNNSAVINVDSAVTMIKLVAAIIQMENGKQPYPVATLKKAFELL
jgi:hypothetical protein